MHTVGRHRSADSRAVNLRTFGGSRLVTVKGAFRHAVFLKGDKCVDTAARDYLLSGELPADRTCRASP
ncbi:alpha/beta hydrolase [Amycolatopsis umgeniensis]|uniref:alpha/beta hydrolase n=1 Tax=Amycolatopsis umgeniensis TaxID=336628 RepID=UPI0031B57F51